MISVDLADIDICLLALERTCSVKGMKMVLPYGVKSRLRFKNWLFIKKELPLARRRASRFSFDEDMITSFFFPECIYIIKVHDKFKLEIRKSDSHTYSFEKVGESNSRITEIINEKEVLDELIGFDIQMFYENVIFEKEADEFNRIMRGKYTDTYNTDVVLKCKKINNALEYSDYTLEIHYSDRIDILVWNKRENKVEFCITENKPSVCIVKIGEFLTK